MVRGKIKLETKVSEKNCFISNGHIKNIVFLSYMHIFICQHKPSKQVIKMAIGMNQHQPLKKIKED